MPISEEVNKAFNIVGRACSQVHVTLEEHQVIQNSLQVIARELNKVSKVEEKTEVKKEKEVKKNENTNNSTK